MNIIIWLLLLLILPFSVGSSQEVSGSGSITIDESVGVDSDFAQDMENALKNAATATESYAVTHGGSYKGVTIAAMRREGMTPPPEGVELRIVIATVGRYCIEANRLTHYDSSEGMVSGGPC